MTRLNESLADLMAQLAKLMTARGENMRARAYTHAEETILGTVDTITDVEQLKGKPGIGPTIMEKMREYVATGKLRVLEEAKADPEIMFADIYGVGPKKAKELVGKGIRTIPQLRQQQNEVLNHIQRIGLQYYEDILKRIPRQEIDEYRTIFETAFNQVRGTAAQAKYDIVGSYRRGAAASGDIDVILTGESALLFTAFIDQLLERGVILQILSRGPSKCLVIARLPGKTARRVDFLYTSFKEYPFAQLYFTGSKAFNTVMRGHALSKGYTMNEHGLYNVRDKKKGSPVDTVFKDEGGIFDFLGLAYVEPEGRKDGRAVQSKEGMGAKPGSPKEGVAEPLSSSSPPKIPIKVPRRRTTVKVPKVPKESGTPPRTTKKRMPKNAMKEGEKEEKEGEKEEKKEEVASLAKEAAPLPLMEPAPATSYNPNLDPAILVQSTELKVELENEIPKIPTTPKKPRTKKTQENLATKDMAKKTKKLPRTQPFDVTKLKNSVSLAKKRLAKPAAVLPETRVRIRSTPEVIPIGSPEQGEKEEEKGEKEKAPEMPKPAPRKRGPNKTLKKKPEDVVESIPPRKPQRKTSKKLTKIEDRVLESTQTPETPATPETSANPATIPVQPTMPSKAPGILGQIADFKTQGISVLENLNEAQLAEMIRVSNEHYYNTQEPLLTDNQYDILKEFMEKKYPKNEVLEEIGAVVASKNKVTLPYEMASMDKIKPDTQALENWKKKYTGPYILSCKLDGVSGMYVMGDDGQPALYTRGNGKVGQDIRHLLSVLKLPKIPPGHAVRGEFILPKSVFDTKYAATFANPRNLVSGIVNAHTVDAKAADLHFVVYEVVAPDMTPRNQMTWLTQRGFEVVQYKPMGPRELSNESLSAVLLDWRTNYMYEIDGIIVADDHIYPRKTGNPDHAFAFKMLISGQEAEAKVVDVLWTASKDKYLKPRVQIEPVKLSGVTIQYVTGVHGKFVEDNGIGIGAVVKIVRSGDVIPKIIEVVQPADTPKMPTVPYQWNPSHIEVMLADGTEDETVQLKTMVGFFKGIGVEHLGEGNLKRISQAGYDTICKVTNMTQDDFTKVFATKKADTGAAGMGKKIYQSLQTTLAKTSLASIMAYSNVFGRGFSHVKIELILQEYPEVITSTESTQDKIRKVAEIKGFTIKTAEPFIHHLPRFIEFMKGCGWEAKIRKEEREEAIPAVSTDHELYGKTVVMTGFRDKKIEEALKTMGAKLGTNVSDKTHLVLVKERAATSGKLQKANELIAKGSKIVIMTPDEFTEKYL